MLVFLIYFAPVLIGIIIGLIIYFCTSKNDPYANSFNDGYINGFLDGGFYTGLYSHNCNHVSSSPKLEKSEDYYNEKPWCKSFSNEPYSEYYCPECLDELENCEHSKLYE